MFECDFPSTGGVLLVLRILASPENVSSVLASVNAAEPMRVHLLAGVAWPCKIVSSNALLRIYIYIYIYIHSFKLAHNWSHVEISIVDKLKVERENSEVYPNVTFTLPRDANLELQGEPGTKMEELVLEGVIYVGDVTRPRPGMLNNIFVGLL